METVDTNLATFATGCFWGVEESFRSVPGVVNTEVGYTGGNIPNPTYKQVCSGDTGHAEAIRLYYDPNKISYKEILNVFWNVHDPTQAGGQGLDIGEQYRSAIFYHDEEQKNIAEESRGRLQKEKYPHREITTDILPAGKFYRAEEYHQRYIAKRRGGKD